MNDVASLVAGMPRDERGMPRDERSEVLRRARHLQTMRDSDADVALADLTAGERVRALMPLPHTVLRQAEDDAHSEQEPWNP